MATCKDCLHVEACEFISQRQEKFMNDFFNEQGREISVKFGLPDAEKCPYFKDRSRFVELPCKVGDKIYFAKKRNYEYATITDVFVRREDTYFTWRAIYYDYDREFRTVEFVETGTFIQSDIGRTIFFTPEEAKQALKECET